MSLDAFCDFQECIPESSSNWLRIIKLCQVMQLGSLIGYLGLEASNTSDRLFNLSEEQFKALGPLVFFQSCYNKSYLKGKKKKLT